MPYDERQLRKHREAISRGDEVAVILVGHDEQRAPGFIRLLRLSPEERGARANKWLIVCLVLSPLTAAFPPHIPWLILTIAVGVIGYYFRRGSSELVTGGESHCPNCNAFQLLDSGNAEFPMAHYCTECGARSLVEPSS